MLIRRTSAALLFASICVLAAGANAQGGENATADLLPGEALESLLHQSALQFQAGQAEEPSVSLDSENSAAPRRWWPIVLSALMPGLGEAVTGHWRGYPLIAADAGLVAGAISKDNTGDDRENEYRAFADEHYSEQVWEDHLKGLLVSGSIGDFFDFEGNNPSDVPLWVSKQEDEREWYENIGKWPMFFFGWEEYWPVSQGGEGYWPDSQDPVFNTKLQRQYVEMRVASNEAYGTRDDLINVSLLLRAFSVVQMAYLEGFVGGRFNAAKADLEAGEVGFALDDGVSAFAAASRVGESRLGVRMRF